MPVPGLGLGASIGLAGVQSALGAITGGLSARRQYKYQAKLLDQQNKQQIEFWRMNNEYNTPVAQRARLEEAGLNPDLFYGGSGSVTPSQMPTAASGQAPRVDYGKPDLYGAFQMSMNMQMMNAQVEKMNYENQLLAERAKQAAMDTKLKGSQWLLNDIEAKYRPGYLNLRNRKVGEDVGLTFESRRLAEFNADAAPIRLRLEQQRVNNDTMRVQAQLEQLNLSRERLRADVRKINAEVDRIMSDNVRIKQLTRNLSQEERNLLAQTIKNEALNKYFYNNGRIPSAGGLAGFIWNTLGNIDTDLGY